MDEMSWKQRGVCAAFDSGHDPYRLRDHKAQAEEQTRFYGPDGRTIGTATTSGNTTTFYGADGRRTGSSTVTGKR
jgi:hypothetical protein